MISTLSRTNFNFSVTLILSTNAFNLDRSKIFLFGNQTSHLHTVWLYFVCWHKGDTRIYFRMLKGRKHCGKKRKEKILVSIYSFFNSVFQNLLLFRDLTLYSIDTHFNASTTDSFRKYCGKMRNCS